LGVKSVNEEALLVEHRFVFIGMIKILGKFKILQETMEKNSVIEVEHPCICHPTKVIIMN